MKSIAAHAPPVSQRGFTLIELMVTLIIAAILAALAIPSFDATLKRWRVRSAAEGIASSIYLARSEASTRGGAMLRAKSPDASCSAAAAEWQCGWELVVPDPGNPPSNESSVQEVEMAKGVRITFTGPAPTDSVTFNNRGIAALGYNFFVVPLVDNSGNPPCARVVISSGGRVRTISGTGTCPIN